MNVVLLPGLDGTGALFAPLTDALGSAPVRMVRYPADTESRWGAYASQVGAQIDASEPFVLFAESFSGPVALRFLEDAGGACRGLVACATFLSDPAPKTTALAAMPGSWLALPPSPPRSALARLLLTGHDDPALLDRVHDVVSGVPPKTVVGRVRMLRTLKARDHAFAFPVCYLRASHDALVAPRLGEEFVARVRGAWIEEVEGPHLLAQANPTAVAKRLLQLGS